MNNINSPILKFGKYKGKSIDQVWSEDRNYVIWFAKNFNPSKTVNDHSLYHAAQEHVNLFYSQRNQPTL